MQRSYEDVKSSKCCEVRSSPWTAALRAAAKVDVAECGPEGFQLLFSCSLSITEAFPTFGTS
eukprot:4933341-Prymnesium_polylepis.1